MIEPNTKRKLKDEKFIIAKIKVYRLREVYKEINGRSYKDKLYCVEIDKHYAKVSTAFDVSKKGRKELGKFVSEEI